MEERMNRRDFVKQCGARAVAVAAGVAAMAEFGAHMQTPMRAPKSKRHSCLGCCREISPSRTGSS